MVEQKQGSPKGESVYLAIGFLRRPHGVAGEVIMDLHTDFPDRIKSGRKVYIGEKHEAFTIDSARAHAKGLLVRIQGFATPEASGRFRNQWVESSKKVAIIPSAIEIRINFNGEVFLKFETALFIFTIYLKKESTNSCLLKTCKSSMPSPTPMYFTGI